MDGNIEPRTVTEKQISVSPKESMAPQGSDHASMKVRRPTMDAVGVLDGVFNRAKAKDEFEYVCALIGMDGLLYRVNVLGETWHVFRDISALMDAPLKDETRLRLGLLLYCHLMEAKPLYGVLENMLLAVEGKRCAMSPFGPLFQRTKKSRGKLMPEFIPPSAKQVIRFVVEHARKHDEGDLATLLETVFDDGLRNAFFHADYAIVGDELHSRHSWFEVENERRQVLKIHEVARTIRNAMAFYAAFEHVYVEHRLSYKEERRTRGRWAADGSEMDMYIYVDPNGGGLVGIGNLPRATSKAAASDGSGGVANDGSVQDAPEPGSG